jgi:hypothetical protein
MRGSGGSQTQCPQSTVEPEPAALEAEGVKSYVSTFPSRTLLLCPLRV